jgi:hypothetical protein
LPLFPFWPAVSLLPFELDAELGAALDFDLDLDFDFDFAAAVDKVVVVVVAVVVVPVVVVCEQLPPGGITKSPCLRWAGIAREETMIGTQGFFFEPVRWQSRTLPGLELVVVVVVPVVVVVVPVVVVPVVVVPVVVVPVVVVVVSVVVVVVVCCWLALANGPLLFATAIDVAKPAARSTSKSVLSFIWRLASWEVEIGGYPSRRR